MNSRDLQTLVRPALEDAMTALRTQLTLASSPTSSPDDKVHMPSHMLNACYALLTFARIEHNRMAAHYTRVSECLPTLSDDF